MNTGSGRSYRQLMQASYDADREFKDAWERRADKRAPNVDKAREVYNVAQNELWSEKLDPLQERFVSAPNDAIDEVIDFLATDIPAYRCGYLKEYFLQHLKSAALTPNQKMRLKEAVLKLCRNSEYRRELRHWGRLMINLADENFIKILKEIGKEQNGAANANFVLKIILENRKDLRENQL